MRDDVQAQDRSSPLDSSWSQFQSDRELLRSVVGHAYGPEPERRIDDIRRDRRAHADRIMGFLDVGPEDVVVDFGSGVGFIAEWIAPRARRVLCLDIGEHHLEYTRRHLSGHPNVEFHLISYADLSCLRGKGVTKFFASAVFIHFNLWDIAVHLRRIFDVLDEGGRAYANIMNSDGLDVMAQPLFRTQLERYERSRSPTYLVTWNSAAAVTSVAESIGFSVEQVWSAPEGNSGLLFRRS
jgi:cyclopropane fatty-acyl-phospholipid synthase-like methyltransferase